MEERKRVEKREREKKTNQDARPDTPWSRRAFNTHEQCVYIGRRRSQKSKLLAKFRFRTTTETAGDNEQSTLLN